MYSYVVRSFILIFRSLMSFPLIGRMYWEEGGGGGQYPVGGGRISSTPSPLPTIRLSIKPLENQNLLVIIHSPPFIPSPFSLRTRFYSFFFFLFLTLTRFREEGGIEGSFLSYAKKLQPSLYS